jgi:GNAT superfamily N-acetyltransferase
MTLEDYQLRFFVRKLQENEHIENFNCGDDDLNDFLINDAAAYREALLATTYLLVERSTNEIAAYFSLANDRIGIQDFSATNEYNRFRRPKFKNSKRLKSYPAVKICRLAISANLKGIGIGSKLIQFIKSFFFVDNKTGCRFVTVDAYADAIGFYQKNKFDFLNNDDSEAKTRVLFFDLNDLRT